MALKLIREFVDSSDIDFIVEKEGEKAVRIKGIFLEAELKNKNSRVYKRKLCEREVELYNKEKIIPGHALGCLNHDSSPEIDLQNVSHKIESLQMFENKGIGVAKLLNTPPGKIAQVLIKEGIVLGVSTRGVGTVGSDGVVDDNFKLLGVDIVSNPSCPSSFVEGILEHKEYIMEGSRIVEVAIDNMKNTLDKKGSKEILETLNTFLTSIK